jgi:hypothetical protein
MTNEEIIRMARETGKTKWFGTHEDGTNDFLGVEFTLEQLKRFTALVAEATKEKAIRVCRGLTTGGLQDEYSTGWNNALAKAMQAFAAIRSMK